MIVEISALSGKTGMRADSAILRVTLCIKSCISSCSKKFPPPSRGRVRVGVESAETYATINTLLLFLLFL